MIQGRKPYYENGTLKRILFEGGYVDMIGDSPVYMFFIKDHLGSVRAVVSETGTVQQINDYYPYGDLFGSTGTTDSSNNRYRFTGKELGNETGLYDFSARFLQTSLGRFTTIDPLAEKYPSVSPYAYCNGNPVNFVDPDGMNPVYNSLGVFLGTDDGGLQGKALFMDNEDFRQGMQQDEAQLCDKGIEFLENEESINSFQINYASLSTRPDWDGEITLEEANYWYQNGNGQSLFVDINKIDLPVLIISKKSSVGKVQVVNTQFASLQDGIVYGAITLKHYPNNGVRAFSDNYGFEMKTPWMKHIFRNIETIIGSIVAGKGIPYDINIYGIKYL